MMRSPHELNFRIREDVLRDWPDQETGKCYYYMDVISRDLPGCSVPELPTQEGDYPETIYGKLVLTIY